MLRRICCDFPSFVRLEVDETLAVIVLFGWTFGQLARARGWILPRGTPQAVPPEMGRSQNEVLCFLLALMRAQVKGKGHSSEGKRTTKSYIVCSFHKQNLPAEGEAVKWLWLLSFVPWGTKELAGFTYISFGIYTKLLALQSVVQRRKGDNSNARIEQHNILWVIYLWVWSVSMLFRLFIKP